MRRPVAVIAALVLMAAVATPVGGHNPVDENGYDPLDDIQTTYHLEPTLETGTVRVTATVRLPSQVDSFEFEPPIESEVEVLDGFTPGGEVYSYQWNGEAERPSMTYVRTVNETGTVTRRAAGSGWAILTYGDIGGDAHYWFYGTEPGYYTTVESPTNTEGWIGDTIVLIGPHRIESAERNGERFELVIPDHADMAADPAAVYDSLGYARQELDMGHRHDATVGVVQPAELEEGGFVASAGWPEYAVHEAQLPEGVGNTWIHEYVHTRQNFSTTDRLEWTVEASAEYEAALVTLQHGNATWAGFEDVATTGPYADANLRTRVHDGTPYADYEKGPAVLAVLDARIRNATDGARSIETVLARMNERTTALGSAEFKSIVADVAGESMNATIDRLVTEEIDPDPPADPFLFTTGPDADNDRDGLTTREEREAGTHPFEADSDGDGTGDGEEVAAGTDPTVPNTPTPTATPSPAAATASGTPTTPGGDGAVGLPTVAALAGLLALGSRLRRRYSS